MVPFLSTSNTRINLTAVSKPADTRRQPPATHKPATTTKKKKKKGITDRHAADGNVGQLVSADRPAGIIRHDTHHGRAGEPRALHVLR
jgi:hypothetical protein